MQEDNLSLLDGISTQKAINQYEKKGLFTVKQLSYTFKPRKRKKRTKNPPPVIHKPELQALAIREQKIYLQELPELTRQPVELFLDIEGIPDQQFYYLIGLLICENGILTYHPFWANTIDDETQIWQQFLDKINQYPDAPIYHYGSFEPRTLTKLGNRYDTDIEDLINRLFNVNKLIYGKVYFPVYSNRLKEIRAFLGATWTAPNASGLQSLIWRHYLDEKHNVGNKHFLLTYNREDCQALQLLTEELSKIKHSARTLSEIDFADQPKLQATGIGGEIHSQFEEMLKFAHANYDKTKINFQLCNKRNEDSENVLKYEKGRQGQREKRSKITKTIQLHSVEACPKCGRKSLQSTEQVSKRLITDFVLTKGGIKKATIQYLGPNKYCTKCHKQFPPPTISKYRANQVFGEGVMAWFVYYRVALRLPYKVINQLALEQFSEKITLNNGLGFIRKSAQYYIETEKLIILKLLTSPFIHVDETPISIKGFQWYVWVFTDGKYVIFRLSETREAVIVRDFLANYEGILISHFYPGYNSLHCPQQKCWVHLIEI